MAPCNQTPAREEEQPAKLRLQVASQAQEAARKIPKLTGQITEHTQAGPMRCLSQQQPLGHCRSSRLHAPQGRACHHGPACVLQRPFLHSYSECRAATACSLAHATPPRDRQAPRAPQLARLSESPQPRACGRRKLTHSATSGSARPAAEAGDSNAGASNQQPCKAMRPRTSVPGSTEELSTSCQAARQQADHPAHRRSTTAWGLGRNHAP